MRKIQKECRAIRKTGNDHRTAESHHDKGDVDGYALVIGSVYFVTGSDCNMETVTGSKVFLSVNGKLYGYFNISNAYRNWLPQLIKKLSARYRVILLSGDHDGGKELLKESFPEMLFKQSPSDKREYINQLQKQGRHVLLIGDGLNDAGALTQSDVGVAVSDDTNTFSPACDAILDGRSFGKMESFIDYARSGKLIITSTFAISLIYNVTGLFFAVQGLLSPVIAAILMPASSMSIVLLSTISGTITGKRIFGK